MVENAAAGVIELQAFDLVLAGMLVLAAGLVSMALRLRLEKRLLIASLRMVVQLLLIGYLLKWVFGIENLFLVLGLAALMIIAASRAAVTRPARTFRGVSWFAFLSLTATGMVTTVTVTGLIIGVDPWWRPQYMIPLLGMILGNGLTGISLSLDLLLESLVEKRDEVEMELALGASAWEAGRTPMANAVRRGMIPIINTMMVVGIVSLPGMMTGQILSGTDPLDAVKYQMVVMFMIAGATALGCMVLTLLAGRRLFNSRHQLEAHRIRKR